MTEVFEKSENLSSDNFNIATGLRPVEVAIDSAVAIYVLRELQVPLGLGSL